MKKEEEGKNWRKRKKGRREKTGEKEVEGGEGKGRSNEKNDKMKEK